MCGINYKFEAMRRKPGSLMFLKTIQLRKTGNYMMNLQNKHKFQTSKEKFCLKSDKTSTTGCFPRFILLRRHNQLSWASLCKLGKPKKTQHSNETLNRRNQIAYETGQQKASIQFFTKLSCRLCWLSWMSLCRSYVSL